MKYTAETRWFYESSFSDQQILQWFAAYGKTPEKSDKRSDLYLLHGNASKSVKLREGKLEVKINAHNWEQQQVNDNFVRANSWKKYSFQIAEGDQDASQVIHDFSGLRAIGINHDWVRLDKERISITYSTDIDNHALRICDPGEKPSLGCMVDYTLVNLNMRRRFTSLGFEAFGNGIMVKNVLDLVLDEVLTKNSIEGLTQDQCMSFPEFILTL